MEKMKRKIVVSTKDLVKQANKPLSKQLSISNVQ